MMDENKKIYRERKMEESEWEKIIWNEDMKRQEKSRRIKKKMERKNEEARSHSTKITLVIYSCCVSENILYLLVWLIVERFLLAASSSCPSLLSLGRVGGDKSLLFSVAKRTMRGFSRTYKPGGRRNGWKERGWKEKGNMDRKGRRKV